MNPLMHPDYLLSREDWLKWRLTAKSGRAFMDQYLQKFSAREDQAAFNERKAISYVPAFAKAAVNEIKNAIFQRLVDVTRTGGSQSYQTAVLGNLGGVDLSGNSMTSFIGTKVLFELLTMSKVGVYVDMPDVGENPSIATVYGKHPYLYYYLAEDIYNWTINPETGEYKSVLLKDRDWAYDDETGFPAFSVITYRFRWLQLTPEGVQVTFVDDKGAQIGQPRLLRGLKRIPFVCLEISDSLLTDVADYQISHMNLASSDANQAFRANFPIYTEQHDPRMESPHLIQRQSTPTRSIENGDPVTEPGGGTEDAGTTAKAAEINLGVGRGRRYPLGVNKPDFIAPPTDPLEASIAKQEQMKREIRQLVHLSVSNLSVKMASAESKSYDERGLESGLSAIGLVLERAERLIAEMWAAYESTTPATVNYPTSYSLKSDEDRVNEAKEYQKLVPAAPSPTYQKEMFKVMARTLLGHKVTVETLKKIESEIDTANAVVMDPEHLLTAVEDGVLSADSCGKIMGFGEGEAEKAAKEHAARLKRIADNSVQLEVSPEDVRGREGREEKRKSRDKTNDNSLKNKQRGEGRYSNDS